MTYLATAAQYLTTWIGRANQAWGTSRTWNTGNSFETDLGTMTTDRNNWQSSSNTWQGRANNAWGTSRVWNSGESWESAYTRVLPPASVVHLGASAAIPNGLDGFSTGVLAAVTISITGQWVLVGRADVHGPASGVQLFRNGGQIGGGGYFWHLDSAGAVVGSPQAGCVVQMACTAGDTIGVKPATGSFGGGSCYTDAYFIPVQSNPH